LRHPARDVEMTQALWDALPRSGDGVPLVVADGEAYLAAVADELTAPLDALPYAAIQHLARYLPHVGRPRAPLRRAIAGALARHAPRRVGLAFEAGCSVGPDLRTLARRADHVIACDAWLAPLRAARALLAGEAVPVPVRDEGRTFHWAPEPLLLPRVDNVTLLAANALDPPLSAETVDIALAVNLLDNVPAPLTLLGQLDAVLKPGGLLVLASPFHWVDAITEPAEQLGGGTVAGFNGIGSAAALRALLRAETPYLDWVRYDVLETTDVPWRVRDHARCEISYRVHVLVARKVLAAPLPRG
jgi:SAM-dependent methyltransferase